VYMTTDTIIQNYQFHHYYNYVYMNKTIRLKKEGMFRKCSGKILTSCEESIGSHKPGGRRLSCRAWRTPSRCDNEVSSLMAGIMAEWKVLQSWMKEK
jgi:hypothetical protein